MVRVCQPGGRVAVLEFSMPRRQPCAAFIICSFAACCPRSVRLCRKAPRTPTIICRKASASFPTAKRWRARMQSAGLAQRRILAADRRHRHSICGNANRSVQPIVLAITGASGAIYGVRLLEVLLAAGRTVCLSISPSGQTVLQTELGYKSRFRELLAREVIGKVTHRRPDKTLRKNPLLPFSRFHVPDRQRLIPDRRHGCLPLFRQHAGRDCSVRSAEI